MGCTDIDLRPVERCIAGVLFARLDERRLGILAIHGVWLVGELPRHAAGVGDVFSGVHIAVVHLFLHSVGLYGDIGVVPSVHVLLLDVVGTIGDRACLG